MSSSTFRLPHWSTIIGLVVLLGILIGDRIVSKTSFPDNPVRLVLDRNIAMQRVTSGEKGVIAQLRQGEMVKYLGVIEGGGTRPCGIIVETEAGERGLLSAMDMGYPLFRDNDSSRITILSYDDSDTWTRCNIVNEAGVKTRVDLDDIRPVLPDSLRPYVLRTEGDYFMSKEKFENLYIGASLADNEKRYRPAMQIDKTPNGSEAYYPNLEVVDFEEGHIYNPIITYDASGIATNYRWAVDHWHSNNRLIVKYLPKLPYIIDKDIYASLISGSLYEHAFSENETEYGETEPASLTDVPLRRWVGLIVYLLTGLIWIFLMCTLPSLIMDASLYCRWLYYHLPDWAVAIIFSLVGLFSIYLWTALMTVWGCLWIFLPVIIFTGLCGWAYSQRLLSDTPSKRCVKCRRMEVNKYRDRKFLREYDEWRPEKKKVDSRTSRWQSWTEVTHKYSNGSTKTEKRDVKNHSRTETLYADYNVLYHVKEYMNYYECQGCHYVEELQDEELQELQRMHTGHHTEVTED